MRLQIMQELNARIHKDNRVHNDLLGLADGFGLSTVAECVETAEEVAILEHEGADYLQGWYFGKPETNPEWRVDPKSV